MTIRERNTNNNVQLLNDLIEISLAFYFWRKFKLGFRKMQKTIYAI